MAGWTPQDINRLIVTGSASLALMILVCGLIVLLFTQKIPPSAIGSVKGLTTGSGIAILVGLIATVMIKGLPK